MSEFVHLPDKEILSVLVFANMKKTTKIIYVQVLCGHIFQIS
jgi:hypothetical protein